MKVAIMTDTNSGISVEEGMRIGVHVLPMPVLIDGKTYYEGVTLTHEEFYRCQGAGRAVSTSQPAPSDVLAMWDRLLEEYDQIVHIPMSSGLSASCQTAVGLAEDYGGKVQVVNNHRISVPQRNSVSDAQILAEQGCSAREIKAELEHMAFDSIIYIGVDTLEYLKRGGRISPSIALVGGLLSIKPVIAVERGEVALLGKARGSKNGNNLLMEEIQKTAGIDFDRPYRLGYTGLSDSLLQKYIADSRALWEGHGDSLPICTVGGTIGTHVGPGAVAVAFFCKGGNSQS